MTKISQISLILIIFCCTTVLFVHAAYNYENVNSTAARKSFKDPGLELEKETAPRETMTSSTVGVSVQVSLSHEGIPVARTITLKKAEIPRIKRAIAIDDKTVKTSRPGGHTMRKHGKHRRRNHCKKRFGCSRYGNRKRNFGKYSKSRMRKDEGKSTIATIEPRKWFEYVPRANRHSEGRVLVGNRSLALFRQELAAAAADNVTRDGSTSSMISDAMRSKKIHDPSSDKVARRIHVSSKFSAIEVSSKHRNRFVDDTLDESGDKVFTRMKIGHDKVEKNNTMEKSTVENSRRSAGKQVHDNFESFGDEYEAMEIVVKRVPRTKSINAK